MGFYFSPDFDVLVSFSYIDFERDLYSSSGYILENAFKYPTLYTFL